MKSGLSAWIWLLGATVLVVVAITAPAGASSSDPHWYGNGTPLEAGATKAVKTKGMITLEVRSGEVPVGCKLKSAGTVENPLDGSAGIGQITEFTLSGCKANTAVCAKGEKLEASTAKLPWAMKLLAGSPIRDRISGIEIKLECHNRKAGTSTTYDILTGALTPAVGDSVLEFASGSGGLGETRGEGATFFWGTVKLTGPPKGKQLTALTP